VETGNDSANALIKKRKRRVCKNQESKTNADVVVYAYGHTDQGGNNAENDEADSVNTDNNATKPPPEEKVAKKRGRKPKGGKIITQHVNENNNTNDMPNIILHLKCSLSNITNNGSDTLDDVGNNNSNVESYNSSQITGSEINIGSKNSLHNIETSRKLSPLSNMDDSKNNSILSSYGDSSMIKVYDPNISLSSGSGSGSGSGNAVGEFTFSEKSIRQPEDSRFSTNTSNICSSNMFNVTYSPDINLYNSGNSNSNNGNNGNNHSNDYIMSRANNMNNVCIGKDRDRDIDNDNDMDASNLNEREIWRKINQLKLSFHKSDICQNLGGTQRSACFWCTCEFDSPAIYIPKSCSKEGYQV